MIPPFWDSPEVTGIGRLPMRSPLAAHPEAGSDELSLDGAWQFRLVGRPEDAGLDDGGPWSSVEVPGCWTMQGFDRPHYTNVQMPFADRPPHPPADNPTGCYRRTFDLPEAWEGRRVVLSIGGAEGAAAVLVNGVFAGAGKDSRLASEYDVTALVRPGSNQLDVVVPKWTDATFLEDQDHWWHGGLTRPVLLRSTASTWIEDVKAIAGLADDLVTGTLDLRVEVAAAEGLVPAGWTVDVAVTDGGGATLIDDAGVAVPADRPFGFTGHLARRSYRVDDVEPWSAEAPNLSTLVVTLRAPDGDVVEQRSVRIGFRRLEIRDRQLLVNGRAVLFRGVNRHDFDPERGRTVDAESMRADVVAMKRHGFNAVRTSHYPPDPILLDLCDELGLYAIDEANLETHAFMFTLCHDPRYLAAWVERGARMVRRDKNHPSVVLWSLGNESGHGANHEAMAAYIRTYDPSRPLHYEGAVMLGLERGRSVTDVVCPMYPPIARIVEWAEHPVEGDDRPLIMCEYSHAMGNSNGCLAEYWDAIESHHGLQGGFIWEWWDHGLRQQLPDGTWRAAYGGDFGESPHDGNFCIDGVVWPDRTPHPALAEHRQLAAPLRFSWASPGVVRVTSRLDFVDSSWLRVRAEVLADGEAVRSFPLDGLPVLRPDGSADVPVDLDGVDLTAGEASLLLTIEVAEDLPWAEAGLVLGFGQLPLASRHEPAPEGRFVTEGLEEVAPRLTLWRAPIDNDRVHAGRPAEETPAGRWRAWGVDQLVEESRDGDAVRYAGGITHRCTVTAHEDGSLVFDEEAVIPEGFDDLARVGSVVTLPAGYEAMRWFGPGPHETYPDRVRGAAVRRWTSTVTDQYVPYIRPQEHGGHEAARWLEVGDLRFDFASEGAPLHVSVSHFTAADLDRATHDVELRPRAETFVTIDAAHRGLGTASCGPDTLPPYLVGPGTYRWRWRLSRLAAPPPVGPVS